MSAGAVKRLHLVYFSPSGSTEKIVRWGCVNRCPKHAITSTSAEMKEIMKGFSEVASQTRLEPEIFL